MKYLKLVLTIIAVMVALVVNPGAPLADGLLVESRVGDEDEALTPLAITVRHAVAEYGFKAEWAPTSVAGRPTLADVTSRVKTAQAAFFEVEFKKAATILLPVISEMRQPPKNLAEQEAIRAELFNSLIIASIVHLRLKETEKAKQLMTTLELSFPKRKISKRDFSDEPVSLRAKIVASLAAKKRATLKVITVPGASVYVNGAPLEGGATTTTLRPGSYWVYARKGDVASDAVEVDLAPGGSRDLRLELELRTRLKREPTLSLVFDSVKEQEQRESALALRVVKQAGKKRVIVLSFRSTDDGPELRGTLLTAAGDILRDQFLPAGSSTEATTKFAKAIAGVSPGWVSPSTEKVASRPSETLSLVKWGLVGCGVGAGLGGASILTSGIEGGGYRNQGIGLAAVGGLCAVGALSLFVRSAISSEKKPGIADRVGVHPTRSGLGLWATF